MLAACEIEQIRYPAWRLYKKAITHVPVFLVQKQHKLAQLA